MFALHLAWRFLREGRTQSILIVVGVGVGVGAFVFVSAIINALQTDMIARTLVLKRTWSSSAAAACAHGRR